MKKRHLLSLCDLYLPFVCAYLFLDSDRVCKILLLLGRRSRLFLSFMLLLSSHLLTSIGDGGVVNIANVHSWSANFIYYLLYAIARRLFDANSSLKFSTTTKLQSPHHFVQVSFSSSSPLILAIKFK